MRYPNLEAELARKAMTVSDLAAMCGTSKATMYRYMAGERQMPLDKVRVVLGQFPESTFEYLFETEESLERV